jgi:hypothetical protein
MLDVDVGIDRLVQQGTKIRLIPKKHYFFKKNWWFLKVGNTQNHGFNTKIVYFK